MHGIAFSHVNNLDFMCVIYVLHPNYLGIGLVPQMHVGIQEKNWSPRQQRELYQKKDVWKI
jgi:hypothetical protein